MALLHYAPPLEPYINILYQDDFILVLDKPSGLLTVPGKAAEHKDSLQLRVQRVFPTARIVHRLDMATSGLIVLALGKPNQGYIAKQFEKREVKKRYRAIVWGKPEENAGTISLPLICDWPNRPKQMVDHGRGKAATTHWSTLETNGKYTLVDLKPVTGRSHQLRVHMLSMEHPILGDRLYAHDEAKAAAPRLQLHACELSFRHPETEEIIEFKSACPFKLPS